MLQAVILDCDGVLFDSLAANVAYYNAVLAALGHPPMDATATRVAHQLSSRQLFEHLFGNDPALIERARAVAMSVEYEPFYGLMQPVPELHPTLATLQNRYRLALATNRGFTAHEVVRRFDLGRYLELAVGINDVPRPKPHPDMLEKCLAHFRLAPQEAVYVGDAPSDHTAATAAGMHFIGVGEHLDVPHRVTELRDLPEAVTAIR
ncbi:MAG: HAD family hydrolase [Deltaproteobacteria bacterium]|nr:HAD family hydrolase [Deltaproteobacteria bacterium]